MPIKNSISKFWQRLNASGPYAPLLAMFALSLIVLSLSRIGLVGWKLDRVDATHQLANVLLQGLRVDVILLSLISLIPVLLLPIFSVGKWWRGWQMLTYFWVILALILMVFLEVATPGFIAEYDVRPNRIFVEYLKYPHEVVSMLWGGFRIHIFASLIFIVLTMLFMRSFMKPWLSMSPRWSVAKTLITWPLVMILLILGIRSTLGHRPANPAFFAITADSMVNSLVLNSGYSVLYATYNLIKEDKSSEMYGKMPREEILKLTGNQDTDIPTLKT